MAKYLDKSQWEDQILIPDEQTPILGGQPAWDSTQMLSGWSNVPAGMLADRTRFLHDRIQEIEQDIEQAAAGSLKIDNNLSDLQDVGQAKFNLELNLVDNVRDADKPVSTATQAALNTKVDKVVGKGLSEENYTLAEKNKLGGIEAGAQVNSVASVAGKTGVVTLNKTDVGLSNVDNTSDSSKPVSAPQQAVLDDKVDKVAGKQLSTNDYTTPEKNKLAGVESGATANATNAQLRDRTTHTGEQAISTVTGLQAVLDAKVASTGGVASGLTLNDGYTEEVFAVTGTSPALSPTNGSIQTWVLSGNSTPTAGTWASGQSMTLMVDDGSAYTINWASMSITWKTGGGTAPTLLTNGYTVIELVKVGSTTYGWLAGDA